MRGQDLKKLEAADKAVLMAGFARIDVPALTVAMACLGAVSLFLLTAVLLIKGAPPGQHIGPHLNLLGTYFPGYSVTWTGSIAGALYGAATGAALGFAWSVLWNLSHLLYVAIVVVRAHWWRLLAD